MHKHIDIYQRGRRATCIYLSSIQNAGKSGKPCRVGWGGTPRPTRKCLRRCRESRGRLALQRYGRDCCVASIPRRLCTDFGVRSCWCYVPQDHSSGCVVLLVAALRLIDEWKALHARSAGLVLILNDRSYGMLKTTKATCMGAAQAGRLDRKSPTTGLHT